MDIKEIKTGNRGGKGMYMLMMFFLAAGIIAGSVYMVKSGDGMGDGIRSYLENFFASFAENHNNAAVFKNSLASNLITAAIIFVMGFFRLGCIGTAALLLRKGFIVGFTSASFIKCYGAKGILVMLSTMPAVLITLPAMMAFAAVSIRFSLRENKKQKKLIFSYIFFLFLIISIFCAASLADGYLTTTFMTWLSPKIN